MISMTAVNHVGIRASSEHLIVGVHRIYQCDWLDWLTREEARKCTGRDSVVRVRTFVYFVYVYIR